MSYGVVYTVPAPIEVYDAIHAEAMKQPSDGLMMHLARKVHGGFQVIEVWESKEKHDRFAALDDQQSAVEREAAHPLASG